VGNHIVFNGPAQADRAFLNQIEQIQGPCPIALGQIDDERQVSTTIWSLALGAVADVATLQVARLQASCSAATAKACQASVRATMLCHFSAQGTFPERGEQWIGDDLSEIGKLSELDRNLSSLADSNYGAFGASPSSPLRIHRLGY